MAFCECYSAIWRLGIFIKYNTPKKTQTNLKFYCNLDPQKDHNLKYVCEKTEHKPAQYHRACISATSFGDKEYALNSTGTVMGPVT